MLKGKLHSDTQKISAIIIAVIVIISFIAGGGITF